MLLKGIDNTMMQNHESRAEMARIRTEFEGKSNASSPNPRYQGMTPPEIARALLKPRKTVRWRAGGFAGFVTPGTYAVLSLTKVSYRRHYCYVLSNTSLSRFVRSATEAFDHSIAFQQVWSPSESTS